MCVHIIYIPMCVSMCVLHCVQCSYEAGVLAVAESAGRILWNHFTEEEEEEEEAEKQGPKSTHCGVK